MTLKENKKVLKLLETFKAIKTWNKEKKSVFEQVLASMRSGQHLDFSSNARIHGAYVGGFYTEKADHIRRGNLMQFRGKKIMVLCVGSGSWNIRHYLVAVIQD